VTRGKSERLYAEMVTFSDQVGRHGNDDNGWFDKLIEECRGSDRRFPYAELYELGRQLITWIEHDRADIASGVLSDLEEALRGQADEREEFATQLLEGTLAEVSELGARDPQVARHVTNDLRKRMGDETKLVWIPLKSL
jgi:hypothetical protein